MNILPIYPWPVTPFPLPDNVTPVPAVPASPGVVLAFEKPPFLCEANPVPSMGLEVALAETLAGRASFGIVDYLTEAFGSGVREMTELELRREDVAAGVVFS